MKRSAEFGIVECCGASFDFPALMARKNRLVAMLGKTKKPSLEERGISLLQGDARFLSPNELSVDEIRVRFGKAVICTGSKVWRPPIEGIEHALSSDEILFLDHLPESIVIIGGGALGLEFAYVFSAFGSRVEIIETADHLLPMEDPDVSAVLAESFAARGITVRHKSRAECIVKTARGIRVEVKTPRASASSTAETVLIATGRLPNTDGLDLAAAGVEVDEKKGIAVDEFLQTTSPNIWAAGDVIGGYMLTPVASHEARVAAANAVAGEKARPDYTAVTRAVFVSPEIASVGRTAAECEEDGIEIVTNTLPYAEIGRAVANGETEGFVKLVAEKSSQRILGAQIIGAEATNLIHEVAIAMKAGLSARGLAETIFVHPTLSETVAGAAVGLTTERLEGCCG